VKVPRWSRSSSRRQVGQVVPVVVSMMHRRATQQRMTWARQQGQFAEIYNARSGAVDGDWQTGGHWSAAPDQTWSATAYQHMIDDDVFGLTFTTTASPSSPSHRAGGREAVGAGLASAVQRLAGQPTVRQMPRRRRILDRLGHPDADLGLHRGAGQKWILPS
jgi:hypothetical protein